MAYVIKWIKPGSKGDLDEYCSSIEPAGWTSSLRDALHYATEDAAQEALMADRRASRSWIGLVAIVPVRRKPRGQYVVKWRNRTDTPYLREIERASHDRIYGNWAEAQCRAKTFASRREARAYICYGDGMAAWGPDMIKIVRLVSRKAKAA
jgi:hypothetical protein